MIDVSVVIVSYNTRDLTLTTVRSVAEASAGHTTEVIVVDNASSDGSAEAIRASAPDTTVIASPGNLGFARAVNLGARHARGRYLLLLNPDTRPAGPFIAELVEYAEKHPERGVYGGYPVHEDGSHFLAGYAFPSLIGYLFFATMLSRLHNPEELPRLDRSAPTTVPALSGCVLLIDMALWQRLDGFDPRFFMYSEDVDLCWRATRAGAQPTLVPAARVIHLGGASSTSVTKMEMLLKGKISFIRKHWSPAKARLGSALIHIGVAMRALLGREPWRTAWRRRTAWRDGWPS